jgi:hypothetical protein
LMRTKSGRSSSLEESNVVHDFISTRELISRSTEILALIANFILNFAFRKVFLNELLFLGVVRRSEAPSARIAMLR